MERGITSIDFKNVDSMVQVHGSVPAFPMLLCHLTHHVRRPRRCYLEWSHCQYQGSGCPSHTDLPGLLSRILGMGLQLSGSISTLTPWQFKKFYINVPSFMTWIFWLFKPLISANTLAKLNVVGSGTVTISAALLPVIDAKELPKRYGGEAEAF